MPDTTDRRTVLKIGSAVATGLLAGCSSQESDQPTEMDTSMTSTGDTPNSPESTPTETDTAESTEETETTLSSDVIWSNSYEGGNRIVSTVTRTDDGTYLFGGDYPGSNDHGWLVEVTPSGEELGTQRFDSELGGIEEIVDMGSAGYLITGYETNIPDHGWFGWISNDFDLLWDDRMSEDRSARVSAATQIAGTSEAFVVGSIETNVNNSLFPRERTGIAYRVGQEGVVSSTEVNVAYTTTVTDVFRSPWETGSGGHDYFTTVVTSPKDRNNHYQFQLGQIDDGSFDGVEEAPSQEGETIYSVAAEGNQFLLEADDRSSPSQIAVYQLDSSGSISELESHDYQEFKSSDGELQVSSPVTHDGGILLPMTVRNEATAHPIFARLTATGGIDWVNEYTELEGIMIETAKVRSDGDAMVGGYSDSGAWLGQLVL